MLHIINGYELANDISIILLLKKNACSDKVIFCTNA